MVRFLRVKFSKLSLSSRWSFEPEGEERKKEHKGLDNFYSDGRAIMKTVVTWVSD
jgi:hypothetical protein